MTQEQGVPTPTSQPVSGQNATHQSNGGMPTTIQRALRGVQLAFAVIVLGTVGAVISGNSRFTGCYYDEDVFGVSYGTYCFYTPGSFYYTMFAGAWTLIISIYFIVTTFQTKFYFTIPALALDVLGIIFWFSSFVSLAVWLGAADRYWSSGQTYGQGRALLAAGTAFGAFLWLSYVAAFALNIRNFILQRKSRTTQGGVPMQQQQVPVQQQQMPMQQQQYPVQQQQYPVEQQQYPVQQQQPPMEQSQVPPQQYYQPNQQSQA